MRCGAVEMNFQGASLSVCMIVKNEAANIGDVLESVRPFADEIVVVDTGSTDETVHLAKRYTPHVYTYPWHDDFAAARNFSLDKAHGAYCLWLDADDRVDSFNAAKINTLKRHFDGRKAFAFELQDFRNGTFFRSLMQVRCLPNRKDVRFRGRVHEHIDWESVEETLSLVDVDIVISHHGYDNPAFLGKKIARNIRLLEMERRAGREDPTLHYYLAAAYSHLGDTTRAGEQMSRVIDLLERKQFNAEPHEAASLKTFWLDAHLFLAKEMIAAKRQPEARRLILKLKCVEDPDPFTVFQLAELHQGLGEHREALKLLERVHLEKQKPTVLPTPRLTRKDLVSLSALSLFALGRRDEAVRLIESLPDAGSRKDVWEAVGLLAGDQGQERLAWEAFARALRLGELTAEAWNQWGVVWKSSGDEKKAEVCWRKALALNPDLESAGIHLANLLWQRGRKAEAHGMFKGLVDNGCQKVPVLLAFALLAAERGDGHSLSAVKDGLKLWLQQDPFLCMGDRLDQEDVFFEIACVLERQGRSDLARIARRLRGYPKITLAGSLEHKG
uniref:Glycosyltransferase n=1 Tax=Desulfacinum infernum TaxID=35837 RepID=A0A832A6C4_9BACT